MTVSEARDAILTKFRTEWANETQISWDNLDYNSNGSEFVRVTIQYNLGSQISLGNLNNRLFRKTGLVFVQVFTRLKESMARSDFLAQKALTIFTNNADSVWFRNQQINSVGREQNGKYYQQNVVAEFVFDDIS